MIDLYLLRASLRDLVRPKKLLAALLLIAVPIGLGILARTGGGKFQPLPAYSILSSGIVYGFILVIMSVLFGTGVIAQEIEQRTITYLLSRPLPRWRLLLIKYVAAVAATAVTVWIASIALAIAVGAPGHVGELPLGRDLLILGVGTLAYSALFVLLAAVLTRPLIWGLVFAFGWESWVPNMPGSFGRLSIMTYLRALSPRPAEAGAPDLGQLLSVLSGGSIPTSLAWKVLATVVVLSLAAACLIFSSREYVPRDDLE